MKKFLTLFFILFVAQAYGAIRLANYNICGGVVRSSLSTVLTALSHETTTEGISGPIDVLFLEEQNGSAGVQTTQTIANLLNTIEQTSRHRAGTVYPDSISNGGSPGVVYNSDVVELIEEVAITTPGPRSPVRYRFKLKGYTSSDASFYVYCCHLKAGEDEKTMRGTEAAAIRQNADALGANRNVIFLGDLNLYTSTEAAWTNFTAAGNTQAFDPINQIGNWHDSSSYKRWHTQSPLLTSSGSLVGGGVDDRFDFQLVSAEMKDQNGFAIIPSTYHTFGNNGTHTINAAITTGTGASASVLTALTTASDHMPVVAEYQVPAVMAVSVDAVPPIVCSGYQLGVHVSNTAAAANAIEADELLYTFAMDGGTVSSDPLPSGWNTATIGTAAATPSCTYHAATAEFAITSGGSISGTADNFFYVYKTFAGNGDFYYRLDTITAANLNAVAGIMIRENLNANAPFAYCYLSAGEQISFRRRYTAGGTATALAYTASALPKWLKLSRSGSTITAYTSADGVTWSAYWTDSISFGSSIYVGFATATFDTHTAAARFSLGTAVNAAASGTVYSDAADGIAQYHHLTIPAAASGLVQMTLRVNAQSQAAENAAFSQVISYRLTNYNDFDGDKDFDLADINSLLNHLGTTLALYDLNTDGLVDQGDLTIVIHDIMQESLGDANLDHRVDMVDLAILAGNFLEAVNGWENGDFNGDGIVNLQDFAIFRQDWNL